MHILMTADTVGGVWTYTQELVTALANRGVRITLISLGKLPRPDQSAWAEALSEVDYRPTEYRLEWMQGSEADVEESKSYLEQVIAEVGPDLLHFNQFCYGAIASDIPKIVVAHSDVVSWWAGVYGQEPPDNPWMRWYRETVGAGLRGADVVVAPSEWMMGNIREFYARPKQAQVIYNGRNPAWFDPHAEKENAALSVGRLWDGGKQVELLLAREQAAPVWIAGPLEHAETAVRANLGLEGRDIRFFGEQSQEQLRQIYSRAAIYAATSRYEPFGLAPLEAALSGCALVANDTPVFRELWGDAACYFPQNDAGGLAAAVRELSHNPRLRMRYAGRALETAVAKFTTEKMAAQYQGLYQDITSRMENMA
jgi:glycogen(starch) synthase